MDLADNSWVIGPGWAPAPLHPPTGSVYYNWFARYLPNTGYVILARRDLVEHGGVK
jgi:hypothetical protein